jgi:dienelactone hydrolase
MLLRLFATTLLILFAADAVRPSSLEGDALLSELVKPPLVGAPALSSDGHFLSGFLALDDERSQINVWHIDSGLDAGDALPYYLSDINWIAWVGGGRLLLSLEANGLVIYDAHLRQLRPLIDTGGPRPGELPPFLLSAMHSDPTSIIMQWEDANVPGFPAVYQVNAVTGESKKIVSAWRPIVRWYVSPEGSVVMGEGFVGRKQRIFGRRGDGGWQRISQKDFFKGPAIGVLTIEKGGATALVLTPEDSDTRAMWRMHTSTGDLIKKLASHEKFDLTAALVDPVTDMAVGASYWAEARKEILWADKEQSLHVEVARRLNVEAVELAGSSRDGRRKLYRQRFIHRPSKYTLYDADQDSLIGVPERSAMSKLPAYTSTLVDIPVEGMHKAMNGVLAHPTGGPRGKAIVMVHGGPVKRVRNTYKPMVSWLAAHGYTVLQPNFRGSSGFGEKWRRAGYAEWGADMQKDVRTSAKWLIEKGYARSGAMCVMGGSYGGYAAMMSTILDDDLFACAVSLNGVSSLPHLVDYLSIRRFNQLTVPRIKGRLSKRTLRRRSPLMRVDLVRIPLLMLHATKDENVPFEHGALMATELRKYKKEHEFIILHGAEHVLKRSADKRIYMRNALGFIDKQISARVARSLF